MAGKYFSRRNLDFILYEVLDVLSLTKHDYFSMHDMETFAMTLDTATGIATKAMLPAYASSDRNQPELINGEVKVHPLLHEYYKAFCASGLLSSIFDETLGGQQLPRTAYAAADFIVGGAHNGFQMFTALANAAAKLITSFGSKELVDLYASKILSGEWAATMCLTETQAGSSLSEIATTAYLQNDGTYKIKGQKIFISAGDHDITENIVHLVLARIEVAPNEAGIQAVSISKKNTDARIQIERGNEKFDIKAGLGNWQFGQASLNTFVGPARPGQGLPVQVASKYTWTDAATLELTSRFVEESIRSEAWILRFEEDGKEIKVHIETRIFVEFMGIQSRKLEGKMVY